MSTPAGRVHTFNFRGFCVEYKRDMTNDELADYFQGIADMFRKQKEQKYGMPEMDVTFALDFKE